MQSLTEHHLLIFLMQLFILLLCARGLGEVFRRFGQPATTAEILVGVFLGPTVLGRYWPEAFSLLFPQDPLQKSMLETVAWIGVLFLLLDTGLEIDFSIAWRRRSSALLIAVAGIITPMVLSFTAMWFLPEALLVDPQQRLLFSLFMATVMSITAMAVTARTFQDLRLLKTDVGFLTISALAVNDIIGWALFSVILGLFLKTGTDATGVIIMILGTVAFATLALTLGRWTSIRLFDHLKQKAYPQPGTSLTVTCLMGLLFGYITQRLGMHALFGFFLAGVMAGEAKSLTEDTRRVISQMVHSMFIPLFFANVGLKIDVAANFNIPLALIITSVSMTGKYWGARLGLFLSHTPKGDRRLIAIAHTPGGMMEIVVALLALEHHMITEPVFVAIVFSAIMSCVAMGPWSAHALKKRQPHTSNSFFIPQAIRLGLIADSQEGVIRQLATCIADKELDVDEMVNAAMQREQEFGTGMGHQLALPHLRLPNLKQPRMAFARLRDGVDWDAPDGLLVRYVFFLLTPKDDHTLHMQLLAKISRALADPALISAIDRATNPQELQTLLKSKWED